MRKERNQRRRGKAKESDEPSEKRSNKVEEACKSVKQPAEIREKRKQEERGGENQNELHANREQEGATYGN